MPRQSSRPPPEAKPDAGGNAFAAELRSFGRRRGRRLSARQQSLMDEALPRLALALADPPPGPLASLFADPVREVWLEIGFGGAEHLIWQAQHNRQAGIIGCEVYEEGVVKALAQIEELGLSNVRLSTEDARDVLRWLPPASLQRAFVLFPDPWPKKRHIKRRLISRGLLDQLARVLAPGAELRIATDIGDYARTILLAARGHRAFKWQVQGPEDWRCRSSDWPGTRYEAKALREGRCCYFLRFLRISDA